MKTRRKEVTGVSLSGSQAGGATISPSELKSLTRNSVAERHWTALLRGRRLRLPWRMASGSWQPPRGWRPMPARERESGELPSPICPCSTERSGRDLLLLRNRPRPPPRARNRKLLNSRTTTGTSTIRNKFLLALFADSSQSSLTRSIKRVWKGFLWDASTTTSSKPSGTHHWSN